jgi:uncharacterized membrane protein
MTTSDFLVLYLLTCVVFFVVDIVWLGAVAKDFYRRQLGDKLLEKPNWVAAVIFYLLFVLGAMLFVVLPAVEADSLRRAILFGGLFGFFTYATYDLTNLATLRGWPTRLVIVDIAWGVVLSTIVSTSSFLIAGLL